MTVEVHPVDMHCRRSCLYCHEGPVRRASRNARPARVDHEAIRRAVLAEASPDGFSLHGGEPLLADLADLEALFAFGFEQYGHNGVQTDGAVITDAHMDLFRRYRVCVGFSIDGPGELNDARAAGTLAETRAASARSEAALRRCLAEGIGCSLIVTLHRVNAAPDRLPRLLGWLRELDTLGLRDARLHALELDGAARRIALDVPEAVAAFVAVHGLERELRGLRFEVFKDIEALLRGEDDRVTCVWGACDPWVTAAVRGIAADGGRTICPRVHKDGLQRLPALPGPLVRQIVLTETAQEENGCRGCRFFTVCKGQCPGTAIGGNWRNRSTDCALWRGLLEHVESELEARGVVPVSKRPDRELILARMARAWAAGIAASNRGCIEDRYRDGRPGSGPDHVDYTDHADHDDLGPALAGLAGGEKV